MSKSRRTAREAIAAASWIELITVTLGVLGFLLVIPTTYRQFFPAPGSLTISLMGFKVLDLSGPSNYRVESEVAFVNKSENDFVVQDVKLLQAGTARRPSTAQPFFAGCTTTKADPLPLVITSRRTELFALTCEHRDADDRLAHPKPASNLTELELHFIVLLPSGESRYLRMPGITVSPRQMQVRTALLTLAEDD
jgi:hypothetical protein